MKAWLWWKWRQLCWLFGSNHPAGYFDTRTYEVVALLPTGIQIRSGRHDWADEGSRLLCGDYLSVYRANGFQADSPIVPADLMTGSANQYRLTELFDFLMRRWANIQDYEAHVIIGKIRSGAYPPPRG